jgi:hypothetical protein
MIPVPRSSNANRIALGLLCLAAAGAVLVSLVGIVLAMLYSGPMADDFALAARARGSPSWIAFVKEEYLGLNGRWAFFVPVGLLLPHLDLIRAYSLLVIPLTLVLATGLYAFWRTLLGESTGILSPTLLAVTTLAVLLACTPAASDYIYWFSAALAYELSISLAMLVVVGLVRLDRHSPSLGQRRVQLLVLGALTLIISGLLEVSGLTMILVSASGGLVSSRQSRRAWLIICGIAIIGLTITLGAPGNKERSKLLQEQIQGAPNTAGLPPTRLQDRISLVSRIAVRGSVVSLTEWLTDVKFLSASVLLILYRGHKGSSVDWRDPDCRRLKWLALGVWGVLLAAWYSAPIWFYCASPPGRAVGSAYTIFLIGWIVNIWLWVPGIGSTHAKADWFRNLMQIGALLVFALSMVSTGNSRAALGDFLHGRLQAYHQALLNREQLCQQAKLTDSADVVLPGIPSVPKSFKDDPLSKWPDSWVNQGLADYYGISSVRLDPAFDSYMFSRGYLFRSVD